MLLEEATLKRLIAAGKAKYSGGSEIESIINDNGRQFVAVDRLDLQRVDHYEYAKSR